MRQKAGEIKPSTLTEAPPPPAGLHAHGREEWRRVAAELVALKMLHGVDMTMLRMTCMAKDQYFQADACVAKYGLLIEMPGERAGETRLVQNPAVLERNRAWMRYCRGCSLFGLTPADRPKLTAGTVTADAEQEATTLRLAQAGEKRGYY